MTEYWGKVQLPGTFSMKKDRRLGRRRKIVDVLNVMMCAGSAVMTVTYSDTMLQTFSVASLPTSQLPSSSFVND